MFFLPFHFIGNITIKNNNNKAHFHWLQDGLLMKYKIQFSLQQFHNLCCQLFQFSGTSTTHLMEPLHRTQISLFFMMHFFLLVTWLFVSLHWMDWMELNVVKPIKTEPAFSRKCLWLCKKELCTNLSAET